jgi:hypothetical protein
MPRRVSSSITFSCRPGTGPGGYKKVGCWERLCHGAEWSFLWKTGETLRRYVAELSDIDWEGLREDARKRCCILADEESDLDAADELWHFANHLRQPLSKPPCQVHSSCESVVATSIATTCAPLQQHVVVEEFTLECETPEEWSEAVVETRALTTLCQSFLHDSIGGGDSPLFSVAVTAISSSLGDSTPHDSMWGTVMDELSCDAEVSPMLDATSSYATVSEEVIITASTIPSYSVVLSDRGDFSDSRCETISPVPSASKTASAPVCTSHYSLDCPEQSLLPWSVNGTSILSNMEEWRKDVKSTARPLKNMTTFAVSSCVWDPGGLDQPQARYCGLATECLTNSVPCNPLFSIFRGDVMDMSLVRVTYSWRISVWDPGGAHYTWW